MTASIVWVLFDKLFNRGLPTVIILLLVFWYTNQQFMVCWAMGSNASALVKPSVHPMVLVRVGSYKGCVHGGGLSHQWSPIVRVCMERLGQSPATPALPYELKQLKAQSH